MTLLPAVINSSSLNGKNLTDVVGKPCKEPCFSSFLLPVLHSYTCYNKHDDHMQEKKILRFTIYRAMDHTKQTP